MPATGLWKCSVSRRGASVGYRLYLSYDEYYSHYNKLYCQISLSEPGINEFCSYIAYIARETPDEHTRIKYPWYIPVNASTPEPTDYVSAATGIFNTDGSPVWIARATAWFRPDTLEKNGLMPAIASADIKVSQGNGYIDIHLSASIENIVGKYHNIFPICFAKDTVLVPKKSGPPSKVLEKEMTPSQWLEWVYPAWAKPYIVGLVKNISVTRRVTTARGARYRDYYLVVHAFIAIYVRASGRLFPHGRVYLRTFVCDAETGEILAKSDVFVRKKRVPFRTVYEVVQIKDTGRFMEKHGAKIRKLISDYIARTPAPPPPPRKPRPKPPVRKPVVTDVVAKIPSKLKKGINIIPVKIVKGDSAERKAYIYVFLNEKLWKKYKVTVAGYETHLSIKLDTSGLPDGVYRLRLFVFTEHEKPAKIVYPKKKHKIVEYSVWTEEYIVVIGKPPEAVKPPGKPAEKPAAPPVVPPEFIAITEAYVKAPPSVDAGRPFKLYIVVRLNRDITQEEARNAVMRIQLNAVSPPAVIPLLDSRVRLAPGNIQTVEADAVIRSPGTYTLSGIAALEPAPNLNVVTTPVKIIPAEIEVVGAPPPEKPPERPRVEIGRGAAAAAILAIIAGMLLLGARK